MTNLTLTSSILLRAFISPPPLCVDLHNTCTPPLSCFWIITTHLSLNFCSCTFAQHISHSPAFAAAQLHNTSLTLLLQLHGSTAHLSLYFCSCTIRAPPHPPALGSSLHPTVQHMHAQEPHFLTRTQPFKFSILSCLLNCAAPHPTYTPVAHVRRCAPPLTNCHNKQASKYGVTNKQAKVATSSKKPCLITVGPFFTWQQSPCLRQLFPPPRSCSPLLQGSWTSCKSQDMEQQCTHDHVSKQYCTVCSCLP